MLLLVLVLQLLLILVHIKLAEHLIVARLGCLEASNCCVARPEPGNKLSCILLTADIKNLPTATCCPVYWPISTAQLTPCLIPAHRLSCLILSLVSLASLGLGPSYTGLLCCRWWRGRWACCCSSCRCPIQPCLLSLALSCWGCWGCSDSREQHNSNQASQPPVSGVFLGAAYDLTQPHRSHVFSGGPSTAQMYSRHPLHHE
jgi:hypothetical protein